jgi:hypothetical protein
MRKFSRNHFALIGAYLIIFMCAAAVTARADEPYAPKVNLPKKMQNRDMWVNMIKQWNVPGKKEVGVPAYPKAHIVSLAPASEMTANGQKYATLPAITLATADDPTKVKAFYQEALKDWKFKNQMGMFDIFWTGKDEFNNMDIRESATTPNVIIMGAISAQTDFMPDAKTAITIVYKPVK